MATKDDRAAAQESLDLLNATRNATEIQAGIPQTPLWHAFPLATMVAALTLFINVSDNRLIWLGIGVAAGLGLLVHSLRTTKIHPKRTRRSAITGFLVFAVTYGLLAGWGRLASSMSEDRFLPGVATLAWLATIAIFVLAIHLMNRIRERSLAAHRRPVTP